MAQSTYKVGDLCNLLKIGQPKDKSDGKKKKEDQKLASMFGEAALQKQAAVLASTKHISKVKKLKKAKASLDSAKKKKENDPPKEIKAKKTLKKKKLQGKTTVAKSEGFNPPPGIVHVSLLESEDGEQEVEEEEEEVEQPISKKKRKRKLSESDDEVEAEDVAAKTQPQPTETKRNKRMRRDRLHKETNPRTIFIGNVPLTVTKKKVSSMFKQFGKIESIRFRCLPPKNPKVPKKVIAVKKDFHPERDNCVAYILFEDKESAQKAVTLNGELLDDLHIRVDMATNSMNVKQTIFVGNLPFDIREEAVRDHFKDCGTVANVRVIRDPGIGLGKGFCYVTFKERDALIFALKLHKSELSGRKIRVEECESNPVKDGGKGKIKKKSDKSESGSKKKRLPFKPSNQTKGTFMGEKATPKRKKKNLKKMRLKFKEKQVQKKSGTYQPKPVPKPADKKEKSKSGGVKAKGKGQKTGSNKKHIYFK